MIYTPLCGAQAIEKVILHVCFSNLFHIHQGIVKLTIVKKCLLIPMQNSPVQCDYIKNRVSNKTGKILNVASKIETEKKQKHLKCLSNEIQEH